MSIPEPRFSVGERVMIRLATKTHFNCDDTIVTDRCYKKCIQKMTGELEEKWWYKTNSAMFTDWWGESVLRPRPKPATESFDELMSAVKQIGKEANA